MAVFSRLFLRPLFLASLFAIASSAFLFADDIDDLFSDPESFVVEEAAVIEDPAGVSTFQSSFVWGGDFTGGLGLNGWYEDLVPASDELADFGDGIDLDLKARLWFDARPVRSYRVSGKFQTEFPLETAEILELFADFNWNERLFFRFGKQSAGWGVSRFYQIADPLSVGVKDLDDPGADLEGPVALRVSLPLGLNTLYFYGAVKDSYLSDASAPRIQDAAFGVKGDFLVTPPKNPILGNGELTLGAFYQKNLAPRAVLGYSTGFGKLQVFTDQAVYWGLDSAVLEDSLDPAATGWPVPVYASSVPDDGLHYAATLGGMYVNSEWKFTAYGEYLFLGWGSTDEEYSSRLLTRYAVEQFNPALTKTVSTADIGGYSAKHNSALSLSWSELPFSDEVSAQVLWTQNWVDGSGMASPSVTFSPFDYFSIKWGLTAAWGADGREWILKTGDFTGGLLVPRRLMGTLAFTLGTGRF